MTDNVVRREVQRRDDPFGIPACFYWTMDEVADWVDSIGYGKYKENFRSHFINGRKLLTVDACVLPRMGITHFGDILGLCKHIREVLGIQRHLRDYNPWQPRIMYMSTRPTSGKKHPQLSYREHANKVESIVQSRLDYFKRRHICYTGWSMEQGWDKQLKEEEKVMREQMKKSGILVDGTTKLIGSSMQERLRAAADRLLSYKEESRQWWPKCDVPTKEQMARVKKPRLVELPRINGVGSTVLGHVNWSPVREIPFVKACDLERKKKSKGARISEKQKETARDIKGIIVIEDKEDVKHDGDVVTAQNGQASDVTEEENHGSGEEKEEKKASRKTKVKFTETESYTKKVEGVPGRKLLHRGSNVNYKHAVFGKRKRNFLEREVGDNGYAAAEQLTAKIQPYRVSAIFHWKPMETNSGYPPLKLDKLVKCGYYYGQSSNV